MSQSLDESPAAAGPRFTQTQGQYLAFIYAYSRIFKRPPAEAEQPNDAGMDAPRHSASVHERRGVNGNEDQDVGRVDEAVVPGREIETQFPAARRVSRRTDDGRSIAVAHSGYAHYFVHLVRLPWLGSFRRIVCKPVRTRPFHRRARSP